MSLPKLASSFARLRHRRRTRQIRAVFLHIPKTAGQSVRRVLAPHRFILSNTKQAWLGWESSYTHERWATHGYSRIIREELGEDVWDRAFTFSFVRNPWARAVSAWKYLDRPGDLAFGLTFEEFLSLVQTLRPRYAPNDRARNKFSWHVAPQAPQLLDANSRSLMDFVGRTENLDADFAEACRRLGIPGRDLPRVNTTNHGSYQMYYDDHSRRTVAELYQQDIETFGYTFG